MTRYHTPTAAEMNEALREQLAEETEMDRERDAQDQTVGYTLAEASDRHVVWLRDVTGAPLVDKPYGRTQIVVDTIKIVYEREHPGAPWKTDFVGVDGGRAKKDGTAGEQRSDGTWTYGDFGEKAPEWLADIVEDFRPVTDAQVGPYVADPAVETPKIYNTDWRIW